jgi:hypothetical protein
VYGKDGRVRALSQNDSGEAVEQCVASIGKYLEEDNVEMDNFINKVLFQTYLLI